MSKAYDDLLKAAFKYKELNIEEKNTVNSLYVEEGKQIIYDFAKNKKVLPFLAVLFSELRIDQDYWNAIAEEYRERNNLIIDRLNSIFEKFQDNGIEKIFVTENFGALLSADTDKALFASGDVDLYADIKEKDKIYESFLQLGYDIKERYSYNQLINTSFYNQQILPDEFYFTVAWNPLSRMKLPSFVEADDFVDWDKIWQYGNTAIKLPDVESLMYICLLHISLHSFSRAPDIRLYIDINNLMKLQVDWDKIINFASRDHTLVRVLTSCFLAEKLISVGIPDCMMNKRKLYEAQISKILRLVYDQKNNCLLYEPKRFKVLMIEALCNDQGILSGIKMILLPNKDWIHTTYCKKDQHIIFGYLKHSRNLF